MCKRKQLKRWKLIEMRGFRCGRRDTAVEACQHLNNKMEELNKEQENAQKKITLNITENVNKEWRDMKITCETLKVVKTIFDEWMEKKKIISIVDKNNQKMGIKENW